MERIRIAKEYIITENLEKKNPQLFVANKDNTLNFLDNKKFDIIWCFSVFVHMPLEDTLDCLKELKKNLSKNGFLLANYSLSKEEKRTNISAFWYTRDQMKMHTSDLGFDYQEIDNWSSKISPDRTHQVMMKLSI